MPLFPPPIHLCTAMLGDSSNYKAVSTYHTQPVSPIAPSISPGSEKILEWSEHAVLGGLKGVDTGVVLVSAVLKSQLGAVHVIGQVRQ